MHHRPTTRILGTATALVALTATALLAPATAQAAPTADECAGYSNTWKTTTAGVKFRSGPGTRYAALDQWTKKGSRFQSWFKDNLPGERGGCDDRYSERLPGNNARLWIRAKKKIDGKVVKGYVAANYVAIVG